MNPTGSGPAALATRMFAAFRQNDRETAEALLAEDFTFTSPYDDHIDRAQYFERCWPNNTSIRDIRFEHVAEDGDTAFVLYECETNDGATFRNCEHFVARGNKLVSVEVFFGDPPTGVAKRDYPRFVETAQAAWKHAAQ